MAPRNWRMKWVSVAAFCLGACAGPQSVAPASNAPHANVRPGASALTAAGKCGAQTDAKCFVEQATGGDKESAVRQAKALVIGQIRSKVTATSEQDAVAVDDSNGKSSERVETHIHYTVKSEFRRGELIKFRARQDDDGGGWQAVAWLDRQEAAKALIEDIRVERSAFEQAVADIDRAAGARGAIETVARAYEVAWTRFAALRQAYYEVQVLLADPEGRRQDLDAVHSAMATAEHQVLRLRDAVKIEIELATEGEFTPTAENHLRGLILSAAGGLDLNTGQHPGASKTYKLRVAATCPCHSGAVGPICELKVDLALHADPNSKPLKLANLDVLEYGTFGQTEKATVEASVVQLVQKHKATGQAEVREAVRKLVGGVVPLAPEVAQDR